jgi:ribonuclease BN (tRNA processing enzyme)
VRLTVIGSSPAWPNPGAAQSGYLLEGPGRLLIDCGPGVLSRLRLREPWPTVDAIAVTHVHLDHVADLTGWLWGALTGPGRSAPHPELWLPPGGLPGHDNLGDAFAVHEYAPGTEFETAGYRITPMPTNHPGGFGFRITDGARTLAHSGDSGPSTALVELARDADLFLCEATQPEDEPFSMHLRASDAQAIAEEAGARRLVLIHRPAELPAPDGCEIAYEGLELDL